MCVITPNVAPMANDTIADYDAHRTSEDRQAAETGPGGAEDRQVFGIRCGGAAPVDGHVRADCPLAGVHMVRDWQRGTASRGQQSRLAGHIGQRHAPVLLAQQYRRAEHTGELSSTGAYV